MSVYLTDNWTTTDLLDFEDFQAALYEVVTEAETPLTVGVFGPWGSGKTSLMRMVQEQLEDEGVTSVRTVWFTAWKYDRHEVLWRAFILRVLNALYPREPGEGPRETRPILDNPQDEDQQKLLELLGHLEDSVYEAVAWTELGPRTIQWQQLLGNAGEVGAEVAATLASGGLYLKVREHLVGKDEAMLAKVKKAARAISREEKELRRRQLTEMEQFEQTFKEAVGLLEPDVEGPPERARLVVFVDDLDRCLPEKAIEVLEAIKLFLEVPGVVFVLGMDQSVIQQGIEARYGAMLGAKIQERVELPLRAGSYLQKIVQIPFHLPALAVDDMETFIGELNSELQPVTCAVFARGLYPNPRQVKRVLNIFRLLRTIARGRLPEEALSNPLLAKTVVIQSQYPELYQLWRQYPTVVQTLEQEYGRRAASDEELLLGQVRAPRTQEMGEEEEGTRPEPETERSGGLLAPYLERDNRQRYALLARMLAYPAEDEDSGEERARFAGLSRKALAAYVRLAGAVESEAEAVPVDVPGDLIEELLSGEDVRIRDAAGRLEGEAPDLREAARTRLLQVLQNPAQPVTTRVSAGDALAHVGDPRFREDAWYLPDDKMLGFVEIPAGPFLMGRDPERDPEARDEEQPQHEVTLPRYYLARTPVTVAQFRAFVDESGHEPASERSLGGPDNHPVVYVTWHDALAYCEWLTKTLRAWAGTPEPLRTLLREGENGRKPWRVILPSEAEWEKGARGDDGRLYPWGDEFDETRLNCEETGIGGTSAAGCFPNGASPYGLLDMSGNVWEWTRSLWGKDLEKPDFAYPYDPDDRERENLDASNDVLRVLRGGSWRAEAKWSLCSVRLRGDPRDDFGGYLGVRVVVSPSPLASAFSGR